MALTCLDVWRRVGFRSDGLLPTQIFLDLANPQREVVEISPTGWKTTAGAGALLETSRSKRLLQLLGRRWRPYWVIPGPRNALPGDGASRVFLRGIAEREARLLIAE